MLDAAPNCKVYTIVRMRRNPDVLRLPNDIPAPSPWGVGDPGKDAAILLTLAGTVFTTFAPDRSRTALSELKEARCWPRNLRAE